MRVLQCNVWCSENDKAKDLGLPDGDCWMPIAIDLMKVEAIKLAGPNEFIGDDKATIHLQSGAHFIIDVIYQEAVNKWEARITNQ